MAYIGKSPDGTGVRSRFYYTQTSGGGTSVSGSSDDGTTLTFSDGAYVDVFLNGVLLVAGTDYNTSTANTIAGLAALANGDVVEVVVYDIFTVADTVSSLNGGTFSGAVGFSGGITGDVAFDTDTLKVDSANNRVGIGTSSPSYKLHSTTSSGSDFAGYFHNSSGSGNGTALVARGGANNSGAGAFIVQDYNGNEDFKVDGLGRVTMPSQPSFLARGITGQPSVGSAFVFNGTDYNRGNHYSTTTGRFTAPVNGFYMFTCHVMSDGTDGRLMIRLFKNGTHMSQGSSSSNASQYQDSRIAFMMYMASGDYAEVQYQGNKGRYDNGATHNHFAGHLLG